ncbi:ester cyclase [Haloferax sp. YSSS75]|uniref:ester cyclase n=1 Tax=Haloferax sp. YSSS75 TaxID=3388564 RepID=UPI00398CD826
MATASTPTPGADANAELARRIPEEIATEGNFDLIDEICTEDFIDHTPMWETTGRDEFKTQMRSLLESFGDFSATVEETVTEGDIVAMRLTLRGTHAGEFMGVEPSGKRFEVGNMVFTRIEDGMVAERWVQPDMLGMLSQLGIVDLPER